MYLYINAAGIFFQWRTNKLLFYYSCFYGRIEDFHIFIYRYPRSSIFLFAACNYYLRFLYIILRIVQSQPYPISFLMP